MSKLQAYYPELIVDGDAEALSNLAKTIDGLKNNGMEIDYKVSECGCGETGCGKTLVCIYAYDQDVYNNIIATFNIKL